jgi:hypothetical protein
MIVKNMSTFSSDTFAQESVATQYPEYLKLETAAKSVWSGDTNTRRFVSFIQLINPADLLQLALGDGAIKAVMSFESGTDFTFSDNRAWTGDDRLQAAFDSGVDYYTETTSATVPADITTSVTTTAATLSGDEIWDCTAPDTFATATVSVSDMETIMACDEQVINHFSGGWPQCYGGDF